MRRRVEVTVEMVCCHCWVLPLRDLPTDATVAYAIHAALCFRIPDGDTACPRFPDPIIVTSARAARYM